MTQIRTSPPERPEAAWPPAFEYLRIDCADTVFVVVAGELDIATVPQLDRVLRDAESVAPQIVLDLGGLEFVSSCGAHLLMEADARLRRAGGRLKIRRAPDGLRRILALVCATAELPDDVLPTTSTYRPRLQASRLRGDTHRVQRPSFDPATPPGDR